MALDLLEDGKPPPEEISEELKARLKSSYVELLALAAFGWPKTTLIQISAANMSTPDFRWNILWIMNWTHLKTYGSWPFLARIFFGATAWGCRPEAHTVSIYITLLYVYITYHLLPPFHPSMFADHLAISTLEILKEVSRGWSACTLSSKYVVRKWHAWPFPVCQPILGSMLHK